MRSLTSILVLMFLASAASAQPGQPDPSPYPPPPPSGQDPQPYPQPPQQPYPQPPQQPYPQQPPQGYAQPQYGQPIQLSPDDQKLLMQGEISDGQIVGGAVANIFLSFGIGQAIQGRWGETGWIFTLGGIASITAMFVGAARSVDCGFDENCDEGSGVGLIVGGVIGFTVFYAWGVVDALAGPHKHNNRVRELRMRLGMPMPMYTKVMPFVAPAKGGNGGGVAGLTFRF
jgi:hypothetical protein